MTRDQFISLCFIALLLFIVYQVFLIFTPFARAIFWAAIMAFAFYPLHERLRRALKSRETLAAGVGTFLIFLIVVPPVAAVILGLSGQARDLYREAAAYLREGHFQEALAQWRSVPMFQRLEPWLPMPDKIAGWLTNAVDAVGRLILSQIAQATQNILLVPFNLAMTFMMLFVFLRDGHRIYRFIYQIAPMDEQNKKAIFGQIQETFAAVIRGQLVTSMAQATMAAVVYWLVGVPLAILFAALTFLTSLIPVIGASFVWLPLVFYLLSLGANIQAGALFILGTFGISLIDNVLKPALIGERTKLPYFLLFFGIMGGLQLYGLMGIFLAPVVLSLFFALIRIYQKQFLKA